MTSLELMTEEVQVWVASLEVADARYTELSRCLSLEEQGRADEMTPILARRFVVAEGYYALCSRAYRYISGKRASPTELWKQRSAITTSTSTSRIRRPSDYSLLRPTAGWRGRREPAPGATPAGCCATLQSEDEIRSLAATAPRTRHGVPEIVGVREARLKARDTGSGPDPRREDRRLHPQTIAPRPDTLRR